MHDQAFGKAFGAAKRLGEIGEEGETPGTFEQAPCQHYKACSSAGSGPMKPTMQLNFMWLRDDAIAIGIHEKLLEFNKVSPNTAPAIP